MANIVFTGKASTPKGETCIRREVEELAKKKGHNVQRQVYESTDYLVATRWDTKKNDAADKYGTHKIGYEEFYELLKHGELPNKGEELPQVEPLDFSDCEDNEGWGLF